MSQQEQNRCGTGDKNQTDLTFTIDDKITSETLKNMPPPLLTPDYIVLNNTMCSLCGSVLGNKYIYSVSPFLSCVRRVARVFEQVF